MTERNIICQGSIPEFEGDGDDLDKYYLPVRGIQVALGKENPLVVLPDAPGVREFVSGSETILREINLQNPEHLFVADSDYYLDRALEASLDMLASNLQESDHHILWPYANTEVSDGWVREIGRIGYKMDIALPRKEYLPHQTRSGWGRRISDPNSPTFPERYGIPYPVSFISHGLEELEEAYEIICARTNNNYAWLKLSASAGGFGLARVSTPEEVRNFYKVLEESGQLYLFGNRDFKQDIEVQEEIQNIRRFASIQYLGNALQTPGGISEQILDGSNWVGNKFNVVNGHLAQRSREIFENFANGMRQEHPEDWYGWGGLDLACVEISPGCLDLVVVENNWGRVTGAHPVIYFAGALGVSDRPFVVRKLNPPKVDAAECWRMLKSEGIAFDRETKSGAVPFPWVRDVDAFVFVSGESESEIMRVSERVMNLSVKNGYH